MAFLELKFDFRFLFLKTARAPGGENTEEGLIHNSASEETISVQGKGGQIMRMTLVYPDGRQEVIRATSWEVEKGVVFFVYVCQAIARACGAELLLFDDGEERRYFTKSDPVSFVDYYRETHVVVIDGVTEQPVEVVNVTHILREIPYWLPFDEVKSRLAEYLELQEPYYFWGPLEESEVLEILDRRNRLK